MLLISVVRAYFGIFSREPAAGATSATASGSKRAAGDEDLLPASTPAVKLHKDASGDVANASTVTATLPVDPSDELPAAATVQLSQSDLTALLAKVAFLEQQFTQVQSQLKEQEHSSIARENAIKDAHRQEIAGLESRLDFLDERVRSKNMVIHGIPDTAPLSEPADLERFVKERLDSAVRGRASVPVSQSITSVSHMGKPGSGRSVLVEYDSTQAKHRAFALSRELRRQGFHLRDELTPKQLQTQKSMEPDVAALRSKGYRPWFRKTALFYSNRGVPRQCKQGEAINVPVCPGNAPRHNSRPGRHPSPSSRDNGITASVPAALQRRGPGRSGSPSFAQAVRGSSQLPPRPQLSCHPHLHLRPLQPSMGPLGGPLTPNRGLPANNNGVSTSQSQFWSGMSMVFLRSGQLAMTHGSTSHSST